MSIETTGPWRPAIARLITLARIMPRRIRVAGKDEAEFFAKKMQQGIRRQAPGGRRFRSLGERTLAARQHAGFGGTAALRRSGDLLAAIEVVAEGNQAFAGVRAGRRGRDGADLAGILRIAEEGLGPITIRVTARMRRFLGAVLGPMSQSSTKSGGIIRVTIPPRPVMKPIAAKHARPNTARARMQERFVDLFG